jgi:hypothetical protein
MVKFLHSGDPDVNGLSSHVKYTLFYSAYIPVKSMSTCTGPGGAMQKLHVDVPNSYLLAV